MMSSFILACEMMCIADIDSAYSHLCQVLTLTEDELDALFATMSPITITKFCTGGLLW